MYRTAPSSQRQRSRDVDHSSPLHVDMQASEARAAENPTVVAASAQRLLDSVAALRAYVQQHISEEGEDDVGCMMYVRLQLV